MSAQHIKHRPALLRFVRALAWIGYAALSLPAIITGRRVAGIK
jgi:hypothetical protein